MPQLAAGWSSRPHYEREIVARAGMWAVSAVNLRARMFPGLGGPLWSVRRMRIRLHDPQFWIVQALIVAVTIFHIVFEYTQPQVFHQVYFVLASLYLFPVLYASFNFGLEGAFPTAISCAVLAVPDILINHHGGARLGESFQVGMILVLALLVGARVDKETVARQALERLERERAVSEKKYRSLFENAGEAILVVSADGRIQEANAAAARLGVDLERKRTDVTEQLGPEAETVRKFLAGEVDDVEDFRLRRPDGTETWVQPLFTAMPGDVHHGLTQVLLRDVTDRHGLHHYAQEIVRAQEDERRRIAQELHDVSVQSVILICRRLDTASEAARSNDPAAVIATIAEARLAAEAIVDELRRFSRDLRPLILEDLGFVPALKRLVSELRQRTQIRTRFEVRGDARRLDPWTELVLFRIGQEALRNAEHHASPTRVSLRLSFEDEVVRLGVLDNGVGFVVPPLTTLVNAGSLGLLGMQERARRVGGRCQVRSKPGEGTHITAEIPFQPPWNVDASP